MANYDWFQGQQDAYEKNFRRFHELQAQGFERVYLREDRDLVLYQCMRGCGTMVHDPDAHMTNVCREYNG